MPADEVESQSADSAETTAIVAPSRVEASPAETSQAATSQGSAGVSLFDARYRWVLLFALRWLRDEPGIQLDLDDPAQMDAAYELLRKVVQEHVRERGLGGRLDPSRVSAIAESRSVRDTVADILRREHPGEGTADSLRPDWDAIFKGPAVREMIEKGTHAVDPSLEPAELDRRARDRRMEFARSFGLHARITEIDASPEGGLRVHVAFDEDIAFAPEDLKALEINGVPLVGAQLVDVRRNEAGTPKVQAVIAVNVDRGSIAALKSIPMSVTATTKDDVRVQAFKMV